jgi:hypothetical protein
MMGISGDVFVWIYHLLFTISRNRPKFNLRKMIAKNAYVEIGGIVVEQKKISFTEQYYGQLYTAFIDYEIREGVMKMCV